MKWLILVPVLFLIQATALAGDYQIVYQEQSPEVSNYVHIDPIIDESNELAGFIYSDAPNNQIVIDRFGADSVVNIPLIGSPVMTINMWRDDTLVVYCQQNNSRIVRIDWTGHVAFRDSVDIPCGTTDEELAWSSRHGIRFDKPDGDVCGIILEQISFSYLSGGGLELTSIGTTAAVLDLDLQVVTPLTHLARIGYGDLSPAPGCERVDFASRYQYQRIQGVATESADLDFSVRDSSGQSVFYSETESYGVSLFVGDFDPSTTYDEVIYYGTNGPLVEPGGYEIYASCYTFAENPPRELWRSKRMGYLTAPWGPENTNLDFVSESQIILAGLAYWGDYVLALNCRTGELVDSIPMPSCLTAWSFFETGDDPTVLNLVARCGSMVDVFQFNTPTAVKDEHSEPVLPSNFSLSQNYPNPFNNSTVISFTNTHRQHLTLRVFNVLGQEVATLYDADTPTGDYRFSWNGLDNRKKPQASGVYFAELQSEEGSRRIKMVLVK